MKGELQSFHLLEYSLSYLDLSTVLQVTHVFPYILLYSLGLVDKENE